MLKALAGAGNPVGKLVCLFQVVHSVKQLGLESAEQKLPCTTVTNYSSEGKPVL